MTPERTRRDPHIVSDPNTPEAQAASEAYWAARSQLKPMTNREFSRRLTEAQRRALVAQEIREHRAALATGALLLVVALASIIYQWPEIVAALKGLFHAQP